MINRGDLVWRGRERAEASMVLALFRWNNKDWAVVDTEGAPTVTLTRYLVALTMEEELDGGW